MEEKKSLQSELIRLRNQEILDEFSYYCICFLGAKDGTILYSIISSWVGFTETKPKRELRAPCKVNVKSALELLKNINCPPLIVNDKRDLTLFFLIGGYALIVDELFERHFPNF